MTYITVVVIGANRKYFQLFAFWVYKICQFQCETFLSLWNGNRWCSRQWLISQSGSLSDYIEQRFSDDLQRTYSINKICTLVVLNYWDFFTWLLLQDNLACPIWCETNLENIINILTWLKIFLREKLLESQDVSVISVDYVSEKCAHIGGKEIAL